MTKSPGETTPIRWALAGFGSGGRIFHAPLLAAAPGVELAAVVTADPDRRTAVSAQYPDAQCVAAIEDLPALGVIGVTISTPPATHLPLALRAMELGLHVVVDKPVGLTGREVMQLRAAADAHRLRAIPYQNRRWDNDFLTLRELLADDRLGTVRHLTSRLDRFRPVKQGWPSDPEAGGGLLLDLGPHLIDQAVQLLGRVEAVTAQVSLHRPGATADDDFCLHLRHASGVTSTMIASLAAPAPGPRFLVQGDRAGVRIEGFDVQEAQLKAGGDPPSLGADWGVDPQAQAVLTDADGSSMSRPLARGRWDTFYPAVSAAVTDRGDPPATMGEAVHTAEIIDASRQSARTRSEQYIAPTG